MAIDSNPAECLAILFMIAVSEIVLQRVDLQAGSEYKDVHSLDIYTALHNYGMSLGLLSFSFHGSVPLANLFRLLFRWRKCS